MTLSRVVLVMTLLIVGAHSFEVPSSTRITVGALFTVAALAPPLWRSVNVHDAPILLQAQQQNTFRSIPLSRVNSSASILPPGIIEDDSGCWHERPSIDMLCTPVCDVRMSVIGCPSWKQHLNTSRSEVEKCAMPRAHRHSVEEHKPEEIPRKLEIDDKALLMWIAVSMCVSLVVILPPGTIIKSLAPHNNDVHHSTTIVATTHKKGNTKRTHPQSPMRTSASYLSITPTLTLTGPSTAMKSTPLTPTLTISSPAKVIIGSAPFSSPILTPIPSKTNARPNTPIITPIVNTPNNHLYENVDHAGKESMEIPLGRSSRSDIEKRTFVVLQHVAHAGKESMEIPHARFSRSNIEKRTHAVLQHVAHAGKESMGAPHSRSSRSFHERRYRIEPIHTTQRSPSSPIPTISPLPLPKPTVAPPPPLVNVIPGYLLEYHDPNVIDPIDFESGKVSKWRRASDFTDEERLSRFTNLTSQQRKINRAIESHKFRQVHVLNDGNCLFYSVSFFLYNGSVARAAELRGNMISWMKANSEFSINGLPLQYCQDPWDDFVKTMSKDKEYGNETCLVALANQLHITIQVLCTDEGEGVILKYAPEEGPSNNTITLAFSEECRHYFPLVSDSDVDYIPIISAEVERSLWTCSCSRKVALGKCQRCGSLKPQSLSNQVPPLAQLSQQVALPQQ